MSNETQTNIERWDEFYANLHKKHPDTLYSLDPAEREEEPREPVCVFFVVCFFLV